MFGGDTKAFPMGFRMPGFPFLESTLHQNLYVPGLSGSTFLVASPEKLVCGMAALSFVRKCVVRRVSL
jgi:hypothetical protein